MLQLPTIEIALATSAGWEIGRGSQRLGVMLVTPKIDFL